MSSDPPSTKTALRLTAALLIAFGLAFFFYYGLNTMNDPVFSIDFAPYHLAGRLLAQGDLEPLTNYADTGGFFATSGPFLDYFHQYFVPDSTMATRWVYFPAYAWIFRPLAGLEFPAAARVWLAVNALICLACLGLLATARRWPDQDHPLSGLRLAWFLFFGLTFGPTFSNLMHGQVTGLIFLCFCVGYWLLHRERGFWAGVALGLIVPFKFYPALFVLYFMWRRQWRVVIGALIASAAVGLVSLLTFGWQANLNYFGIVVNELQQGGIPAFNNESILGLLLHAFTHGDISSWANISVPGWLIGLRLVLVVLLLAVCLWVMRRPPHASARSGLARDLDLALVVFIMLLASPITWYHYYMWLLMPLFLLFDTMLFWGGKKAEPIVWLAIGYGLLVVEGIVVLRPLAAQALDNVWLLRVLLSQSFFGAVLLLVLTLRARQKVSMGP